MSEKIAAPNATSLGGPQRPLSPFMLGPYYRFQLTSVLSFGHRLTGIGLSIGSLLLALWVICAAGGGASYQDYIGFAHSILGRLLLLGWSWALFYHLCNGIRHLVWDAGFAFDLKSVYLGGWIVVAASVVLTAAAWSLALI